MIYIFKHNSLLHKLVVRLPANIQKESVGVYLLLVPPSEALASPN